MTQQSHRLFSRFLSTDGSSSGIKDMARAADEYYIEDTDDTLHIARLIVFYQDGGGGNVSEYGNLGAPLATGIEVKHVRRDGSTVITDFTDGVPIQANGDWARFCYDHQALNYGNGDDIFCARWTFAKSGRELILEPGESLRVIVNDSLALLTKHYALVQGLYH